MINTLWCILLMRKFEINFLYVACNQGIYWNLEKNSENSQIFLQIFLFKISSKIREFFEAIKDRNSIRLLFSITGVTKPVGRLTTSKYTNSINELLLQSAVLSSIVILIFLNKNSWNIFIYETVHEYTRMFAKW